MKNLLIILLFASVTLQAQHTVIEYNSNREDSPHIHLLEDDTSPDEMARIWFGNSNGNDFWTVGARANTGSMDFDGTLEQNPYFTIGFNRVQKFAISKDGDVRINASYILPKQDGSSGQVMTTDGQGQLSWSNCCSGNINSVNDFHRLHRYSKPPSCATGGSDNGIIIFDDKNKKVRVCIDGKWRPLN